MQENKSNNTNNSENKSNNTNNSENKSNNTKLIINRLKSMLKISTDTALSEYLGVAPNTISTWKGKNKPDYDLLIKKFDSFDLNYILKGDKYNPTQTTSEIEPPGTCQKCISLNQALKSTEKALEHAESEIEVRIEITTLLTEKVKELKDKISTLEGAHDGSKRKSA